MDDSHEFGEERGHRSCRVWVRCYAELNDFLAPDRRSVCFPVELDVGPSLKDLIEGVGVPHTEVDLVLVDGESVDFSRRVGDGDRVSVYPVFRSVDVGTVTRVRPEPLAEIRFVLDTHLGRLARYLRLVGFDTDYENDRSDAELARISKEDRRILLTCDRGLLKRNVVTHGYAVRERRPRAQLLEVAGRFELSGRFAPFTRCLACNGVLEDASLPEVAARVPPSIRERFRRYRRCPRCGGVYWQGSHHARLARLVEEAHRAG